MEAPHSKEQLTTPFGRFIEKRTYCGILCFGVSTIVVSAIAIFLLPEGQSLKDVNDPNWLLNLLTALYFSAVTFTTVGYGDVLPQGLSRVVALIDAFLGLGTTALLIGKIASERQYSMLLLLHTSDCQRRVEGFIRELESISQEMDDAVAAANGIGAKTLVASAVSRVEAISNYVAFHLNQSRLAEFGNEPSLKALCQQLAILQSRFSDIFTIPNLDLVTANRCFTMSGRLIGLVSLIASHYRKSRQFHGSAPSTSERRWFPACCICRLVSWICGRLISKRSAPSDPPTHVDVLSKIVNRMAEQNERFNRWSKTNVTGWSIDRVSKLLPKTKASTWPPLLHKTVANASGFSNKFTVKCINELIQRGWVTV